MTTERAAAALRVWQRHPSWSLAVKGALAAALAWLAAGLTPPPLSEYAYFAPLGAVIATSSTTVRSIRESAQAVGAVLFGAAIAWAIGLVPAPGALAVALVVGVALLCAGWSVFGEMGAWVVTSALFVLILGSADQLEYVGAFAGLVLLGASIGVAINLLAPALRLVPSDVAMGRLRVALVEQIGTLADRLDQRGPLAAGEWERRRRALRPTIDYARDTFARTREATRANRRVRRYGDRVTAQVRLGDVLSRNADVVDDIVRLLAEWERHDRADQAFGPALRPRLVVALRAYAEALHTVTADGLDHDVPAALDEAVDALSDGIRTAWRSPGEDHFVAGALVVTFWHARAALDGGPDGAS